GLSKNRARGTRLRRPRFASRKIIIPWEPDYFHHLMVPCQRHGSLILFFEPYIETNISDDDMIKLGKLGFEIDRESIDSIQLPPMELIQEKSVNGKAVLYVEPEQVKSYVKSVLSDDS
ncbi:hypothetical protein ABEV74_22405, partial [Paenibacillus cisolokensis]